MAFCETCIRCNALIDGILPFVPSAAAESLLTVAFHVLGDQSG